MGKKLMKIDYYKKNAWDKDCTFKWSDGRMVETIRAPLIIHHTEYGKEKKSVICIWTDDQKKLLSYLNVDGWDMTNPSMSEKMKQLVEDKDPQRLRNVVDGWTQDWHGCVSYPALAPSSWRQGSCHATSQEVSLCSCSSTWVSGEGPRMRPKKCLGAQWESTR
jgi:hypothetical protein